MGLLVRWVVMLCLLLAAVDGGATSPAPDPAKKGPAPLSIAFYYGSDIPWESLGAFDWAVVDPGQVDEAGWSQRLNPATNVVAYVSVGEVHPSRPYFGQIKREWQVGENTDWGSVVLDQTQSAWRDFFLDTIVEPLWQRGYRAFFLDTLDSFNLVAKTPQARQQQTDGLLALLQALKRRHPEAKLIFNRGFEVLPQAHPLAFAVAAESLFKGYDAGKREFRDVPPQDFEWLWAQLRRCKDEWGLPVIAIDYLPAADRAGARAVAKRIQALGANAWVATPELNNVGVGNVELLPRTVLALHDQTGTWAAVATHELHRLGEMPLNALGLDAWLVASGSEELKRHAERPLVGRFAGVVMWFTRGSFPKDPNVLRIFNQARLQGVPVLVMGTLPDDAAFEPFNIDIAEPVKPNTPFRLEKRSPHVGFEVMPAPIARELSPALLRDPNAPGTELWLRVHAGDRVYADAVAITPWGGYAAERFWKLDLPQDKGERWAVNPLAFFRAALKVDPSIPVPDVTTDSGQRLLLVHVDGDGFASRAEIPGTPLASEVLQREFLERYTLPTTMSVIQGETGATGLYKALSPQLEGIARRMFALPHVELATHSYSHPFYWGEAELGLARGNRAVGLNLPGYKFDVTAEISGSANYINTRLAPVGKRTRMMLWSGDTQPLEAPLREAQRAQLLNMNGGFTTINKAEPSLTLVGPIGMRKGSYFQVYAPNQNENVYTNNWLGPFYGFERVLETFELTDAPLRLKPVNIYFHTYIASKPAAIASLHKVYQWALSQPLHPVYASEYALRVQDWRRATVARLPDGQTLELRSGGPWLRQWRVARDAAGTPVDGFAGNTEHLQQRYLHAIQNVAIYAQNTVTPIEKGVKKELVVSLERANGRLLSATQGVTPKLVFHSHMPLQAQLQSNCAWDAAASSPDLQAQRDAGGASATPLWRVRAQSRGEKTLVFRCAQ